jgi:Meiotically up-regulated gene 113
MIEKTHILAEIRRTATKNGGRAFGRQRFENETGIRATDWYGRYWSKWSDAVTEAGLEPNQKQQPYEETLLVEKLATIVTELGRFPVSAELRMKARADKSFPSHTVWAKLGPIAGLPAKLLQHCSARPDLHHLLGICQHAIGQPREEEEILDTGIPPTFGYVYLIKFRNDFKIGASNNAERRYGEIATQMPEAMTKVHTIKTDDPFGVESYWHRRFGTKRLKGEWFRLSPADVRAFKRWKTIF